MRTLAGLLAFALAFAATSPPVASAEPNEAEAPVVVGAWIEQGEEGVRRLVVGLTLPAGGEATRAWVTIGVPSLEKGPGSYGTFPARGSREVRVEQSEVLLVRRSNVAEGAYVLVTRAPLEHDVDVHDVIDGSEPPGTLLCEHVGGRSALSFDRAVAFIGDPVAATLSPPGEDGFFREETLEIVRVPRHLALEGDDPESARGWVTVSAPEDPAFRALEDAAGEARLRAHFTNPRCPWAERHVGWMGDLWILEYLRPATLRLSLDTSTVKAAGRVSDVWRGYGAFAVESIWPNGFGGSSSNLTAPCLLVVPKGTRIRVADE
jgi:hypothetical protein